ncbi:MAG: PAS domain S-box protein [Pseudomonadota bacterium]
MVAELRTAINRNRNPSVFSSAVTGSSAGMALGQKSAPPISTEAIPSTGFSGVRSAASDSRTAERVKVKIERYTLLLRSAPIAICISGINALITLVVVWGQIDPLFISVWAGMAFSLALIRLLVWYRAMKKLRSSQTLIRFSKFHIASMAINGAIWGALAPIFAISGLLGHAFLPFIFASMTAAAIASAGASWKAVMAFNTPVLVPLAVSYGLLLDAQGLGIAAIIIIYGVTTTFIARQVQGIVTRSIRLRSRDDSAFNNLNRLLDSTRESEKRFRALIEASADITIIFSPDGRITYASPSVERVLGACPETLIGKTSRDIVHPDDLVSFREVGGRSLSKIGEVLPLPHICLIGSDGAYRNFSGRLTNMLYVPGVEGFVFNASRYQEQPGSELRDPCGNAAKLNVQPLL